MNLKINDSNESKLNFENILENQKISDFDIPKDLLINLFSSPQKEEIKQKIDIEIIDDNNKNTKETKNIFEVIYPETTNLFKNNNLYENDLKNEEYNFKKRIKSKQKLKRFKCRDNIRKMIKRRFFNTYLKNALNKKLKKAGYKLFFEYFPQCFVGVVIKEKEKIYLNMELRQFFEKKDLYKQKNLTNYYHNLKVLKQLKDDKNEIIEAILDKKYIDLFNEYLNSKEFKIDEMNRLKNVANKHKKDDYYIEKYKYLANHFIEFCQKK
jgi:hypothetical protein